MPKISVLFKPIKSDVMGSLQLTWYYEIKHYTDLIKVKAPKVLIHCEYEKLGFIYEKLQTSNKEVIVLVCKIWDLFD